MSRRIYSCRTLLQFDEYLISCQISSLYRSDFPMGFAKRLTARVTGGWGEEGCKTGNRQSSEITPKNAPSPSRPVHALLGGSSLLGSITEENHAISKAAL